MDLFAIVGFLLLKSGGYHHVSPAVGGGDSPRMISISEDDRELWAKAGRNWRKALAKGLAPPPATVMRLWSKLGESFDSSLFIERLPNSGPRPWWPAAVGLLAIADEASLGVGFETGVTNAHARQAEAYMRQRINNGYRIYTLSNADRDQVCVLPKSRTPKVGCTLRSLTHNLALLPSRGLARAYWSPAPPSAYDEGEAMAPFNLVIIPTPFKVRANAFKAIPAKDASWGWFHIDAHWCPGSGAKGKAFEAELRVFIDFVTGVLDAAAVDVDTVHGLVFPEAALSQQVFERLCEALQGRPGLELLVSGLIDARMPNSSRYRSGNFAAMARFSDDGENGRRFDISTREKHHRWRIERSQIDSYALGSALDVNSGWWEKIDILSRSLDVFVLRGGATVTTLICEDLARNDPCQELVRGIGPNLLIALLMDGPQLKDRWPARYATVLAEDPGSSVLSVTSKGLIARSNATRRFPPSDKIALWRDDTGRTEELSLPDGAHGLCLTLQPGKAKERSLDGRLNEDAQSWRLSGIVPITAELTPECRGSVLEGQWPQAKVSVDEEL
ncbi:hypothetical protein DDF62_03155 [Caulobacter radicis]|nr:hypothetical protein DDF62_03155 [Caulobacter radicis]